MDSLNRHSVTTEEVDDVLAEVVCNAKVYELSPGKDGNDRIMFVGLTSAMRLIEVGVEYIGDDDHVFHAMDAGSRFVDDW